MNVRNHIVLLVLAVGILLGGCKSGRIPCPDVSGRKSWNPLSLIKKKEPTPEDQAQEGRDIGGRNMEFGAKDGLLKKKTVKLQNNKKKQKVKIKL